jgi:hypothetical protein
MGRISAGWISSMSGGMPGRKAANHNPMSGFSSGSAGLGTLTYISPCVCLSVTHSQILLDVEGE